MTLTIALTMEKAQLGLRPRAVAWLSPVTWLRPALRCPGRVSSAPPGRCGRDPSTSLGVAGPAFTQAPKTRRHPLQAGDRWHCGFLFPAKRAARQGGARKKGPLTWRRQPQRGLCVQGVQAASATPRTPPPSHLLALTPSVGCSWRLTSSKRKAAEGTDVIPRPGSTEAASVQGAPPLLAGP